MKKYKAIFFDWDGTAVAARSAPVDEIIEPMKKLLRQNVKLAVVSGTTYENIAGGRLAEYFEPEERKSLYLGLGRGVYNYRFDADGTKKMLGSVLPDRDTMLKVHEATFDVHTFLFKKYGFNTDIVFNRPNYCKIDLLSNIDRGEHLFFQSDELEKVSRSLLDKGYMEGLNGLIRLASEIGKKHGLHICATTDAKYLEMGLSTKSDNVNQIFDFIYSNFGIDVEECCFWGDEFLEIGNGIFGSDSFMITEQTKRGDFFDVSDVEGSRPKIVTQLGGGVSRFEQFLVEQSE